MNLVSNAVKFTSEGEIVIKVRLIRKNGNDIEIGFEVRDTGIGIEKDKQGGLFDAFMQGDSSTTRRYGGTGLGLAMSKSIAEQAQGDIWFETHAGEGTTFYVKLPLLRVV